MKMSEKIDSLGQVESSVSEALVSLQNAIKMLSKTTVLMELQDSVKALYGQLVRVSETIKEADAKRIKLDLESSLPMPLDAGKKALQATADLIAKYEQPKKDTE